MNAEDLIRELALAPHPEGGYYREFFRSPEVVMTRDGRGERAALSAILFLLCAGDVSRWHSVVSDEQWTFLEGEPLELTVLDRDSFQRTVCQIGPADGRSGRTAVVPGRAWQTARPLGSYTLVTCTVGPGFDFADFSFMADDSVASSRLRREAPELARFL